MNDPNNNRRPVKNLLKVFNSLMYLHKTPQVFTFSELYSDSSFSYLSDYSDMLLLKDSPPPEGVA
jgi:hypothetical protein